MSGAMNNSWVPRKFRKLGMNVSEHCWTRCRPSRRTQLHGIQQGQIFYGSRTCSRCHYHHHYIMCCEWGRLRTTCKLRTCCDSFSPWNWLLHLQRLLLHILGSFSLDLRTWGCLCFLLSSQYLRVYFVDHTSPCSTFCSKGSHLDHHCCW